MKIETVPIKIGNKMGVKTDTSMDMASISDFLIISDMSIIISPQSIYTTEVRDKHKHKLDINQQYL